MKLSWYLKEVEPENQIIMIQYLYNFKAIWLIWLTLFIQTCPFILWDIFIWSSGVKCPRSFSEVAQSCPTLCGPVDCSLPGSAVHGIFQARVLEWVIISFSRGSSQLRDWTRIAHIVGRHFTVWATKGSYTPLVLLSNCFCPCDEVLVRVNNLFKWLLLAL